MGEADYRGVHDSMRLDDDTPWTLPILLHVPEQPKFSPGGEIQPIDGGGSLVATLKVEELYRIPKKNHTTKVYGAADPAHPGVAKLLASPETVASGKLKNVVKRKTRSDDVTLSPKETRVLFKEKGWRDIIAFQTRNPPTSATSTSRTRYGSTWRTWKPKPVPRKPALSRSPFSCRPAPES